LRKKLKKHDKPFIEKLDESR